MISHEGGGTIIQEERMIVGYNMVIDGLRLHHPITTFILKNIDPISSLFTMGGSMEELGIRVSII